MPGPSIPSSHGILIPTVLAAPATSQAGKSILAGDNPDAIAITP